MKEKTRGYLKLHIQSRTPRHYATRIFKKWIQKSPSGMSYHLANWASSQRQRHFHRALSNIPTSRSPRCCDGGNNLTPPLGTDALHQKLVQPGLDKSWDIPFLLPRWPMGLAHYKIILYYTTALFQAPPPPSPGAIFFLLWYVSCWLPLIPLPTSMI